MLPNLLMIGKNAYYNSPHIWSKQRQIQHCCSIDLTWKKYKASCNFILINYKRTQLHFHWMTQLFVMCFIMYRKLFILEFSAVGHKDFGWKAKAFTERIPPALSNVLSSHVLLPYFSSIVLYSNSWLTVVNFWLVYI